MECKTGELDSARERFQDSFAELYDSEPI